MCIIKYIGKNITLKNIKDAILDFKITEIDTITLHPENFKEITTEFKQNYNENILHLISYFYIK